VNCNCIEALTREHKNILRIADVFTRDSDGTIRHSYTGHPWLAPDITERGIDEVDSYLESHGSHTTGPTYLYTKHEYPGAA
jgi:hypothetical protein